MTGMAEEISGGAPVPQQRLIEAEGAYIVYKPRSRRAHVRSRIEERVTICGIAVYGSEDWLGGGSYDEWLRGRQMPLCARCRAFLVEHPDFGFTEDME